MQQRPVVWSIRLITCHNSYIVHDPVGSFLLTSLRASLPPSHLRHFVPASVSNCLMSVSSPIFNHEVARSLPDDQRMDHLRTFIEASTKNWRGNHINVNFLQELGVDPTILHSIQHGFSLPVSEHLVADFPNHKSLASFAEDASAEWARLERLGKVLFYDHPDGPSASSKPPKPENLHCSPHGAQVKPRILPPGTDKSELTFHQLNKMRITTDLKFSGVNKALVWSQRKLKFGSIAAAASITTQGGFSFICDLSDCFFHWALDNASSMLLGAFDSHRNQYLRYLFLPFGLASAPDINDMCLKEILRKGGFSDLVDFIDDFFGHRASKEDAWRRLEELCCFLIKCGIKPTTKIQGLTVPSQQTVFVGFLMDTLRMLVIVPDSKRSKAITRVHDAFSKADADTLFVKDLMSVVGFLQHLTEVFVQGRRHLFDLWAVINSSAIHTAWAKGNYKSNPKVTLTIAAREQLEWWRVALTSDAPMQRRILDINPNLSSLWTHASPDFQEVETILVSDPSIIVVEGDASKKNFWSYHLCNAKSNSPGSSNLFSLSFSIQLVTSNPKICSFVCSI